MTRVLIAAGRAAGAVSRYLISGWVEASAGGRRARAGQALGLRQGTVQQ